MSNVVPAVRTILRRRTFVTATLATLVTLIASLFALGGEATGAALTCSGTIYAANSSGPANANWTSTSSGLWVPGGSYPGASSCDVAIDTNTFAQTITVDSTIPNPLSGLTFNCPACAIDIVSGGHLTIDGPGSLSGGATIRLNGGTLTINGSLGVSAGSTIELNSGTLDGSGAVNVTAGSAIVYTSASPAAINGVTINNAGTIQLAPTGAPTLTLGGTIVNTGLLTIQTPLTIGGSGTISNGSSFQYSASGSTTIQPAFNQTAGGGATIFSGTLHLAGGGNSDAPFSLSSGATLDFPGNTYTLTPNGTISGAGALSITGGYLSIGGVTNPDYFVFTSGTLDGAGFLSVGKQFDWSGGTMTGSGGSELAGTGVGNFTGANSDMTLNGRSFNDYGTINYTATTNELYLANSAVFSIFGTFDIQNDGTIGAGSASPGTLKVSPNGVLKKTGGANTATIEPNTTNDSIVFVSSGTLQFTGGGTHTGSFTAYSGAKLSFSTASYTFQSGSAVGGAGTVEFTGGSFNTLGGTYNVDGETRIDTGATVRVDTPAQTNDFTLTTGGTLTVNEDFTMTGNGTWSGGTIGSNAIIIVDTVARTPGSVSASSRSVAGGEFHIATSGTLTIDGTAGAPTLRASTLTNAGTINYTATVVSGNYLSLRDSAVILNDGLFDIKTDAPIKQGFTIILGATTGEPAANSVTATATTNTIDNAGTFQKSAGSGTTDIEPAFTNSGTVEALIGTMNFTDSYTQTAGETKLAGGNIQVATPMLLSGGVLSGAGTITGDVQNNAEVSPGTTTTAGTITITGSYTQGSTGSLTAQIGGASPGQFDQVAAGATTLNGAFKSTLINGYEPPNGATFAMVTYSGETGTFSSETLPTWPHGSFTSAYTASAYVLTAVVTPSVADLMIGMSGPATVNAGAALSYTINITNNGPDPTVGTITVVNTLPAGATAASGSGIGWTCGAPTGGTITCTNPGIINQGVQLSPLTIAMTAPIAGGNVSNSATVSSTLDTNSANNTASVTTNVVAQANLAITKNGPAGVVAGQNVTYTIVVTNNGVSDAANVVVSDIQPANLTWVSNGGACTSNFPCGLGTMTPGQTATITATYSTSPSFSGNVTNTATVASTTTDPNGADNSATATTNVGAQADLGITKSGPATTSPGQNVTYTIVVTNNGPSPAVGTVVSDLTPVGLAFQNNTGACTTTYPCSLGTLASGQSATILSTYTVPNNYIGASIVNTASVSSSVNDPNTTNDTAMATTTVAQTTDLSISKSGPGTASTNQNITYTITVTNLGPSQAGSVVVSDNTPPGLTFVSNTGACTSTFPCSLGTMNASQTATITSTYNIPANYSGSSVANTASVSSAATDSNGANNSSTTSATIIASADLAIVKSGPASFTPGQNIVYTITVTNNGTLAAANTFVSDTTPTGLTFVGNSGACTGTFPCALGTLAAGQSATITSTYSVPSNFPGASVTNTANVSSSTADPNTTNNTSSVTTPRGAQTAADIGVTKSGPSTAAPGSLVKFTINVFNSGPAAAPNVVVTDPTPSGLQFISNSGACSTPFPCTIPTVASQQIVSITATYRVQAGAGTTVRNNVTVSSAATDPSLADNHDAASVDIGFACPANAPTPIAPAANAVTPSPVTFTWSSVPNATGYVVRVERAGSTTPFTSTSTSLTTSLTPGNYVWTVVADASSPCTPQVSKPVAFTVCGVPTAAPSVSVVGETATGQTYEVRWTGVDGVVSYELQEASDANFTNIISTTKLDTTSKTFTKSVGTNSQFHYRVRGLASCGNGEGPFSLPIAIVVLPVPVFDGSGANVNVPAGSQRPVTFQLHVPGIEGGSRSFVATVDKPWLSVTPTNGIVPPEGVNLLISADPSSLQNGTWTGTVLVIYGSVGVFAKTNANATSASKSFPVSISLVTPVTPVTVSEPASSAVIIPSVGHLPGFESTWRSDVRVANISSQPQTYQLTFNSGNGESTTPLKKTTINIDAGATTALDDIVRNWYGIGSLADSSNGLLTIEQVDSATGKISTEPFARTTVVSSRTFNTAESGTLGQFVPAVPFGNFIGRSGGSAAPSIVSLQQLSQSNNFRTNVGVLEATGKPVSLLMSVFDSAGAKLLDLPIALRGGEQKQLNSVLAQNGIPQLTNGRVEVKVASGDGKATAYASVIDNRTNDPLLISGSPLGGIGSTRFVLAGIADLNTPVSSWRSDVRIFNSGAAPQNATLTFYPIANATASVTKTVAVNPGEVLALDNVLQSVFGVTDVGGALHATTAVTSPLIVTARTYDQTANGTRGQFIPAITQNDAVGSNDRALNILQAEESVRYRTNLGIAEVTGKPTIVEVTVSLPDSRVSPRVQIPLGAFESRQLPILSSFGIGATYNARISVKVIDGDGKITAYGSVIDMLTQDPTYIPAQ
jgi:uncharacterized repeat protein (TIGR01451 family)